MHIDEVKKLIVALSYAAVVCDELEFPKWNYDGTEVKTADDVAVALGIPTAEAYARMGVAGVFPADETKDMYGSLAGQATTQGVGTVLNRKKNVCKRARALAYKRRKSTRKKD